MKPRLRVLMVCSGNICRSPTAEAVLRRKLKQAALEREVEVDSAGTVDFHAGSPPDRRAQVHGGRRGYDLGALRARLVRDRDFERFDLLLAMDADHVDYLIDRCPEPYRERIRRLMEFAPAGSWPLDVPDPYYGAPAGFERVLDQVEAACDGLVEHLRQRLAGAA
jgi:protein-tyrosine phosphatase